MGGAASFLCFSIISFDCSVLFILFKVVHCSIRSFIFIVFLIFHNFSKKFMIFPQSSQFVPLRIVFSCDASFDSRPPAAPPPPPPHTPHKKQEVANKSKKSRIKSTHTFFRGPHIQTIVGVYMGVPLFWETTGCSKSAPRRFD